MERLPTSPAPDPVATVVTDRDGRIVDLNPAAVDLLKISAKGLRSHPRTLEMFFSVSRQAILAAQRHASPTLSNPITVIVRPREHGPRSVVVRVQEAADGYLEWTIEPIT